MAGAEELAENLQRQLDELEAIEAILMTTCSLATGGELLALHRDDNVDAVVAAAAALDRPEIDVSVSVPVGDSFAQMRVSLPPGYPATAVPRVLSCRFNELTSKASRAALADELDTFVASAAAGDELLLELGQWVAETAEQLLHQQAKAQAQAAAAKAAASTKTPTEWRRFYFWVDHLLKGKEHKKEAQVEAILKGSGLSGKLYYGRPGLIAVEGPEAEVDEIVRECGKAGKTLKVKKSQLLPAAAADRFFPPKATTAAASKSGGLDIEALQQDLKDLGLEHKFKHIIGLEDLQ